MIFKLVHGGVKESLALTVILREWKQRHPKDDILLETSIPELFYGNADITEIGSWDVGAVIDLDIISVQDFDMHLIDIYAFAAFGDNRLLSRRMVTGYHAEPVDDIDLLMSKNVVKNRPDLALALYDKYDAVMIDFSVGKIESQLSLLASARVFIGGDEDITWLAMTTNIPMVMFTGPSQTKNIRPFREGIAFESLTGNCPFIRDCLKRSQSLFGNVCSLSCRNEQKMVCENGINNETAMAAINRFIRKEVFVENSTH